MLQNEKKANWENLVQLSLMIISVYTTYFSILIDSIWKLTQLNYFHLTKLKLVCWISLGCCHLMIFSERMVLVVCDTDSVTNQSLSLISWFDELAFILYVQLNFSFKCRGFTFAIVSIFKLNYLLMKTSNSIVTWCLNFSALNFLKTSWILIDFRIDK